MEALQVACDEVGRDAADLSVIPIGTIPESGKLEHYASLGIAETVLRVPSACRDEVLPVLDTYMCFLSA
jgi:hypothetical protein